MTGMKKKIASLLLMLTLIMCQMPAMVFANDVPADVPPADQQEQTVGQDGQNDKNDQNGQPIGGQMNLANAGDNEEGTDSQTGDDVSKEQTTGNDANGTDETNGGGPETTNEGIPETSATGPVPEDGSKLRNTLLKTNSVARFYVQATTGGDVVVKKPSTGDVQMLTKVEEGKTIEITNQQYFPVSEGDNIGLTAEPKEGYTFDGWYIKWNSTDAEKISSNPSITYTLSSTNSETYTAYFKSNSNHAVTFDTRGHYAAVQQQTVADGGKATKPNSPASDEQATDYTTTGLHFRNWSELSPSELTPENFWSSGYDFANTSITADKK